MAQIHQGQVVGRLPPLPGCAGVSSTLFPCRSSSLMRPELGTCTMVGEPFTCTQAAKRLGLLRNTPSCSGDFSFMGLHCSIGFDTEERWCRSWYTTLHQGLCPILPIR